MTDSDFFEQSREQSDVKAAIVAKYFWAWAKVIIPSAKKRRQNIGYIDLFAGPGRYEDGTSSTPLLVLEKAIEDRDMRRMLVTLFNDKNPEYARRLEVAIAELPGIDQLAHAPQVVNVETGDHVAERLERISLVPCLLFVDPWGYKGLSLRLIKAVLRRWGCDCIFFFNYNRVNMNLGLSNQAVTENLSALFGPRRAEQLRAEVAAVPPEEREMRIVSELTTALQELGGEYVLPFCFKNERGTRTSHHLILVTKHVRGYGIMKRIMASYSSTRDQGVPSFLYNPADERYPLLFELTRPLDDLADMLLQSFAGRTLTMEQIYDEHHVGRPYIEPNYKDVLAKLEAEGRITTDPPADRRPRRKGKLTFANHVRVTFPPLEA